LASLALRWCWPTPGPRHCQFEQAPKETDYGNELETAPFLRTNPKETVMGSTTDKIKGTANEVAGKARQAFGKSIDNHEEQVKGSIQEAEGKAQVAKGEAKEAIKKIVDKA
jgi:uncharacterized protein YjbJ (UPF0337 family)